MLKCFDSNEVNMAPLHSSWWNLMIIYRKTVTVMPGSRSVDEGASNTDGNRYLNPKYSISATDGNV